MNGEETPRAQGNNYDPADTAEDEIQPPAGMTDEEDLEEDANVNVARRAVRRYPEESQGLFAGRQVPMPITRLSCDCPEVMTKGTLAAIVAALAFLGFFSTSVLLVVSIWVLRLMGKQKKTENGYSKVGTPSPPVPPPRPEHTYAHPRRSSRLYEAILPARTSVSSPKAQSYPTSQCWCSRANGARAASCGVGAVMETSRSVAEAMYLSASEINPGPRIQREQNYGSPSRTSPGNKSTPENEYITTDRAPPPLPAFTPPQAIYSSLQRSGGSKAGSPSGSPGFRTGSPGFRAGSPNYPSGSPGFHGGSPALPSGSPVGSPVGSPKGRKTGAEEHIYDELN